MRYVLLIVLIIASFSAFAQPKEVQVELSETFAQYQNAYNNATAAYNMLEKGYKKSGSIRDARYYLGSASKYSASATDYCQKAASSAEATLVIPSVKSCEASTEKYSGMKNAFERASEKFQQSQAELDKALKIEDFNEISKLMADAITYLQSGVKQLNLSVEEMNAGSKSMKGCK